MNRTARNTALVLLAFFAAAAASAQGYEPPAFESNYPTYVLSDDSAANPQPFEANYPVAIKPFQPVFAPMLTSSKYYLSCSKVTPPPFEDCYPVFPRE